MNKKEILEAFLFLLLIYAEAQTAEEFPEGLEGGLCSAYLRYQGDDRLYKLFSTTNKGIYHRFKTGLYYIAPPGKPGLQDRIKFLKARIVELLQTS